MKEYYIGSKVFYIGGKRGYGVGGGGSRDRVTEHRIERSNGANGDNERSWICPLLTRPDDLGEPSVSSLARCSVFEIRCLRRLRCDLTRARDRDPRTAAFQYKVERSGSAHRDPQGRSHAGWRPIRKPIMAERSMRRIAVSPLTAVLVMMLVAVAPDQAYGPHSIQATQATPAQPPPPQPTPPQGAPGQAGPGQPIKIPARHLQGARRPRGHRVGHLAACCPTRPTSTSIATAASGWPRASATAPITPVSPKATASSCCRTKMATARLTAPTPSCRSRR